MTTIEIHHLSKRFDNVVAVEDLSFTVRPGAVTGFLGPNGAGKTTTLKTLLGLLAPSAGRATFDGRPYAELAEPYRHLGAVLEYLTGQASGRQDKRTPVIVDRSDVPPGQAREVW